MSSMKRVRSTAPGKLMLMGEHSVLEGGLCLVAAVNRYMTVTLAPRDDRQLCISSSLGQRTYSIDELTPEEPFAFVLESARRHELPCGFDLEVESGFHERLGLGSSAAVSVATCAAFHQVLGLAVDPGTLFDAALEVVQSIQGLGSGADVAASICGGILHYRANPLELIPLKQLPPICAVYSGSKEKTVDVVGMVRERLAKKPKLYHSIYQQMDYCIRLATRAIEESDWESLGEVLNVNQGLMDAIGVNNKRLSEIVYDLRNDPGIYGAKISGSGLGDCVVALGTVQNSLPHELINLEISQEGVVIRDLD